MIIVDCLTTGHAVHIADVLMTKSLDRHSRGSKQNDGNGQLTYLFCTNRPYGKLRKEI